jgi:hypothetical protein
VVAGSTTALIYLLPTPIDAAPGRSCKQPADAQQLWGQRASKRVVDAAGWSIASVSGAQPPCWQKKNPLLPPCVAPLDDAVWLADLPHFHG